MSAATITPLASLTIRGATASSAATVCGKLFNQCVLASIAVQNAAAGEHGTAYVGAAPPSKTGALQWQTYENHYSSAAERELQRVQQRQPGHSSAAAAGAAPKRTRTHRSPVTITTRPRQMFTAVLSLFADLACSARGSNGLASVVGQACPEAAHVRSLIALTEGLQPVLKRAPLSADNRMAVQVRHMLDLIVGSRSGTAVPAVAVASAAVAAAYIEPLTALFMDFLRCVAWQTAALAFENGRGKAARTWTLNRENLCGIIISLSADLHALKQFMVDQVDALEEHLARTKDAASVASSATSAADLARADPVRASAHDVFLPDGGAAEINSAADSESDSAESDSVSDAESDSASESDTADAALSVAAKINKRPVKIAAKR
jgi:hypothetical protein